MTMYVTDHQGTLTGIEEAFIVEVPDNIDVDDHEEYVRDLNWDELTHVADLVAATEH